MRQKNHSEVIHSLSVKAAALNHKHFLLQQQIEHKALIVFDIKFRDIYFRK
jgi:hypothetical protein